MMEMWTELIRFFDVMENGGSIWKLGLLAFACCLMMRVLLPREKRTIFRRLTISFSVLAVLLLNPLTLMLARNIAIRFGVLNDTVPIMQLTGMVPVAVLIAVTAAALTEYLTEQAHERGSRHTALAAILLFCVMFLFAGGIVPFRDRTDLQKKKDVTWNQENTVIQAVLSSAQTLVVHGEVPLLVAPKGIMDVIRQYDGTITLAYGRDLWQTEALPYLSDAYTTEQILLCQAMESGNAKMAELAEQAMWLGCNILVLPGSLSETFQESHALQMVCETQDCFVYLRLL